MTATFTQPLLLSASRAVSRAEWQAYFKSGQFLTLLLPLATLACAVWFIHYYITHTKGNDPAPRYDYALEQPRGKMTRKDWLPLLLITVLYACVAFFRLGDFQVPESGWLAVENTANTVSFDMGQEVELDYIIHHNGALHGNVRGSHFKVETSLDGETWTTRPPLWAEYGDVWYWLKEPMSRLPIETRGESTDLKYDDDTRARYIRLTSTRTAELNELGIYIKVQAESGLYETQYLDPSGFAYDDPNVAKLFDEQQYLPEGENGITYMNRMYFDEIYHGRTAYENIHGIYPYETTHPPLGKLIISLGIRLFGMVPFGWRCMGTLFGVLMLPFMYWLLKNLFNKTSVATCGTILLAAEFMHLTQTRIATIDTYGVFFILVSYLFMYRYITSGLDAPFRKTVPSLFFSGLAFGLGCASKWIVLYAGVGLMFLYITYLSSRFYYAAEQKKKAFTVVEADESLFDEPAPEQPELILPPDTRKHSQWGFLLKTLAVSLVFFIVVPAAIYTASYVPYVTTDYERVINEDGSKGWYKLDDNGDKIPLQLNVENLIDAAVNNSKSMYNYHSGVQSDHPYAAPWYVWLIDGRPMLFYANYINVSSDNNYSTQMRSAFASFNNPLIAYAGLLALGVVMVMLVKKRTATSLFIVIGFMSQFLPWLMVPRETYAYHYFPSIIFLILAICYLFNDLLDRGAEHKWVMHTITGIGVLLFVLFLPVLIGILVPDWYAIHFLRWYPFNIWPF